MAPGPLLSLSGPLPKLVNEAETDLPSKRRNASLPRTGPSSKGVVRNDFLYSRVCERRGPVLRVRRNPARPWPDNRRAAQHAPRCSPLPKGAGRCLSCEQSIDTLHFVKLSLRQVARRIANSPRAVAWSQRTQIKWPTIGTPKLEQAHAPTSWSTKVCGRICSAFTTI